MTKTCRHCPAPARDDGSDYADVCAAWPNSGAPGSIAITLGTIAPNDCIDTLRQSVDFLPIETPVRVLLAESPGDMFGYVSGVRLDTGRRGTVRDGVYRPDAGSPRHGRAQDIPPNVVTYLVRDEITGLEFECAPGKVLPYARTHA